MQKLCNHVGFSFIAGQVCAKSCHMKYQILSVALLFSVVFFSGCGSHLEKQRQLELRRSFKNYIESVKEIHEEGLKHYVFFPDTVDYPGHVRRLLLQYLEEAETGEINFDEQGVVLIRFLGLVYHRYVIIGVSSSEDGMESFMRIGVSFDYDANLSAAGYEEGTLVYIPGTPWGRINKVVIGGENDLPREQLAYIEIDLQFRRTNFEGYWQLRRCVADPSSAQFEMSFKADF